MASCHLGTCSVGGPVSDSDPLPSSCEDLRWHLGPSWVIRLTSCLRTLNVLTSAKSLLPQKVIYSQITRMRIWACRGYRQPPRLGLRKTGKKATSTLSLSSSGRDATKMGLALQRPDRCQGPGPLATPDELPLMEPVPHGRTF